ncbi:MAG: hypothetical protein ACRD3J_31690 [Thermoanaerobaculia bacterium]
MKVSPTPGGAGAYTVVADINKATMSRDGAMLEITQFGDSDIKRILGLRDCTYDLAGFYNSTDTNGQNVIDAAAVAGSELWVEFLPNGVNGWKQQVMVPKFSPSADVKGTNDLTIQLVGTGPITAI